MLSLFRRSWVFSLVAVSILGADAACVGDDPVAGPNAPAPSSSSSGAVGSSGDIGSSSGAVSSGSVADTGPTPVGTFCERSRTTTTLYCADFDTGPTDAGAYGTVTVAGEGASVSTADFSVAYGRSLDVQTGTDGNQSSALLELPLPLPTSEARIELDMFIETVAEGTGRLGDNGFLPLLANGNQLFTIGVRDIERDGSSGVGSGGVPEGRRRINPFITFQATDVVDMGAQNWVHVTHVLKLGDRQLQVAREDGTVVRTESGGAVRMQSLAVGILRGGDGTLGSGAVWRVFYDNILVTSTGQ